MFRCLGLHCNLEVGPRHRSRVLGLGPGAGGVRSRRGQEVASCRKKPSAVPTKARRSGKEIEEPGPTRHARVPDRGTYSPRSPGWGAAGSGRGTARAAHSSRHSPQCRSPGPRAARESVTE
ncbi:hypothetical protein NDU88_006304 [Pleurodeles waltl]|uniref:Uncharacterized protein n=1 Tax=Pleurodeles waltl TaxID=8319 RepID=A0AAV7LS48_PLEWA|nr:hypothetical protein NDU88_006304 [Pleurodeles waltl]